MKNKFFILLQSIRGKFLLLQLILLFIILLLLGLAVRFFFKNHFYRIEISKMELISQSIEENIEQCYDRYKEQINRIVRSEEFENYSKKYQDIPLIKFFSSFLDKFSILSYVSKNGQEEVKVIRNYRLVSFKNIKDSKLFKDALLNPNTLLIGEYSYHEEIEDFGIEFIFSSVGYFGNEFIGVCRGIIPLEGFTCILSDKKIGNSGFLLIIDQKGYIVFHPDKKYMGKDDRKIIPLQELIRTKLENNDRLIQRLNVFDKDYIVSAKKIENFGWTALILLPYDEFISPLIDFQRMIFIIVLVIFGISLFIVLYLTNKITFSLEKLKDATSTISDGNFKKTIDLQSKDEVQKVAEAFNIMVKRLDETTVSKDFAFNIIENISDFLFVLNNDLTLNYANTVLLEKLNYTNQELESMELVELIEPIINDNSTSFKDEFIKKGVKNIKDYEVYLKKKDSTRIPVLISMIPVVNNKGEIKNIVCVAKDITLIKQREEDSIKARMLAEEANKLKSEFLANVSHEIRTPLNCVIGFAEIMQEVKTFEEVHDLADKILHEGNILLDLIIDLLDHAKIEANMMELKYEPFNIKKEMNELIDIFKRKIDKKNIKIKIQMDKNIPLYIIGDLLRIRQILSNLMSNAIKFTEKGLITVNLKAKKKIDKTATLYISVVDTGIGIPQDKLGIIFDRFKQVDSSYRRKYGGTGLGTFISKKLVELMGGEIGVESEFGKGSTFWFYLDLEYVESFIEKKNEDHVAALQEKEIIEFGTVLVAEDYIANQQLIKNQLNKLGARAHVVSNGLEAVEACKKNKYDYIFMDCQMPVCDGYEATAKIRKLGYDKIPIIALTAHAGEISREECLASGMNDILSKPIRKSMLLEMLKKWH